MAPSRSKSASAALTLGRLAPTSSANSLCEIGTDSVTWAALALGSFCRAAARKNRASRPSIGCKAMASSCSSATLRRCDKNLIAASAICGRAASNRVNAAFDSVIVCTRPTAVASAERVPPSNTAISPKIEPGSACANDSSRPSAVNTDSRTRPFSTTWMSLPWSPREKISWPVSNWASRISLSTASRAASSSDPNSGARDRSSRVSALEIMIALPSNPLKCLGLFMPCF